MEKELALPLLLNILLLLQVCSSVPIVRSGDPGTVDGGVVQRAKRQDMARMWTTGQFTDCSATCGGGIMVRSVRCLDEDGVIVQDCNTGERPASFQFCNQIDCVTNDPNTDLPPFDTYTFDLGNGSSAVLEFQAIPMGQYQALLNVTEVDGTMTMVDQTRIGLVRRTSIATIPANNRVEIDGDSNLLVDGQMILGLEGVEVRNVTGSLSYNDSVVSVTPSGTTVDNVDTFYYFDGFRFYRFNTSKMNPLSGPGTLYVNPVSRTALYTNSSIFSNSLSMQIDSLGIGTTIVTPAMTTDQPTSMPTSVPTATPTGEPPETTTGQSPETTTGQSPEITTGQSPETQSPETSPESSTGQSGSLGTTIEAVDGSEATSTIPSTAATTIVVPIIPGVTPIMPGGAKSGTRCTRGRTRTSPRSRESSGESSSTTRKSHSSAKKSKNRTKKRKNRTKRHKSRTGSRSGVEADYEECETPMKSTRSQMQGTKTKEVHETSGKSMSRQRQGTKTKEVHETSGKSMSRQRQGIKTQEVQETARYVASIQRQPVSESLIEQGQGANKISSVQRQLQGSKNRWVARSQRLRWEMYRKLFRG